MKKRTITQAQYEAFQVAYDFFNAELFAGTLPPVLVTLQRHAGARGYFSPERFSGRLQETTAHELAMNPDSFIGRNDEDILSTLAHEMVHVWQQAHGMPPTRSYHDRQWAAKMKQIGLQPSHDGKPGGKETGQQMTHYIVSDGPYAKVYKKLAKTGLKLGWESHPQNNATRKAKKASKTKFTCPECGQNAWAKPDTLLMCGTCYEDGEEPLLMLAENLDEQPTDE